MYVCICTYVYICTYMYIYIYVHIHICMHIYIYTYKYIHIYVYTNHMLSFTRPSDMAICVVNLVTSELILYTCIYLYMYVYIHIYKYIYILYKYIYIYIYECNMLSFTRPSKMTICIINLVTSERTFNFWERFVLIYIYVYLCLCVCVHVYVYMYIHIHLREEHGSVHALASNQGQVEIPKIEPYILLISQKSALQSFDAANSVLLRISTRKTRTGACSYCKSTVGFFFFVGNSAKSSFVSFLQKAALQPKWRNRQSPR